MPSNPAPTNATLLRHSVGAVFVNVADDGTLKILANYYTPRPQYQRRPYRSLRVPTGTGEPGETVAATLAREIGEEVQAGATPLAWRHLATRPVYSIVTTDDITKTTAFVKLFFALAITGGTFRTTRMIDQPDSDQEELLEPLRWYEADELLELMKPSPLPHPAAVLETLAFCAQSAPAVRRRYDHLLRTHTPHVPAPEVLNYLGCRL